jgi:DNA-binding transcriptional regulator LsrR (DeoR family)
MTQAAAHWLCHEGISAARLRVVYKGRPASIDASKVAALRAEGLGATEIAKRLKIGRASVYRLLLGRRGWGVSTRVRSRRLATGAGRRVLTRSHDADVVSFRGQLQSLPKERLPPSPAQAAANMRHDSRQTGMTLALGAGAQRPASPPGFWSCSSANKPKTT